MDKTSDNHGLKHCPYCGSEDLVVSVDLGQRSPSGGLDLRPALATGTARCPSCEVTMLAHVSVPRNAYERDVEEAVLKELRRKWNRRSSCPRETRAWDEIPASERQVSYARAISEALGAELPAESTKKAYSEFISSHVAEYNRHKALLPRGVD